jgi:hypothetical protein
VSSLFVAPFECFLVLINVLSQLSCSDWGSHLKGVVLCTPLMKGSLLFQKKKILFWRNENKGRGGEDGYQTKS